MKNAIRPTESGKTQKRRGAKLKWTDEAIIKASKAYSTLHEFYVGVPSAYQRALKTGLLGRLTWLARDARGRGCTPSSHPKRGKYTFKTCREVALKYASRTEFAHREGGAYAVARKHGWLPRFTWMKSKLPRYTEARCASLSKRCKHLGDFSVKFKSAYNAARRNGWIDNFTWLRRVHGTKGAK